MLFNDETVNMIRENSLEMERAGSLTQQVLNIIYENGLFKLFVPEEFGGKMMGLPDALKIFEQASRIDGSFGWLVNIGSGGGYFIPSILPTVSQEVFSDKKAVIAGSGFPSGTAERVDGGFVVNGQWKYCSGSTHATVFTANCKVEGSETSSNPEIRSFILLPEQVKIVQDWKAFGLKATASHSIAVENAFVPEEMTFDIFGNRSYYDHPVYQYPFVQFAQTSFTAVSIGICKHFLDEAKQLSQQNKEAWQTSHRYDFVINKINDMEQLLARSSDDFYKTIAESWKTHARHKQLSKHQQEEISRQCKETTRVALTCAQSILPYLGINAIMEDTPVNQTWRDLHTACQNTLVVPFYDIDIN